MMVSWLRGLSNWRKFVPLGVLLTAATLHGLPALCNAAELHSDAAVVGLQARHLLLGEWSRFLWGSGYQTSTDSVLAAFLFWFFGATPLMLMLSSFLGHLVLVSFAFATLRRHFSGWSSALLVSPLVVTTGPLHIYMFSPPRQAALTLIFAAIWCLDGASNARRPALWLALGAFVSGAACFADPYALLFLPALALFALSLGWGQERSRRVRCLAAAAVGAVLGLVPVWALTHSAEASPGVFRLHTEVISHNLKLLDEVCLPYLLATTAWFSPSAAGVEVWPAPVWFRCIQWVGAVLLLLGVCAGGVGAAYRAFPAPIRRLAALGSLMLPVTLAGFALSVMVMDRLSARYLVAIVLMAPFALAPALQVLGQRRFALLLSPFLLSATVAGWLSYGDDVAGPRIVIHHERSSDEALLAEQLREHDLHYGLSDYWVAYRLTFLFGERTVIVPWHEKLDRYPPYRSAVAAQLRVAYIFDPWRSKEELASREADIASQKTDFAPKFESFRAGRYTVLILRRTRGIDPRLATHGALSDPG